MSGKKATISDISKVVGMAPSTVYKALSGNKGVNDSNRQRILQIAEELGYVGKTRRTNGSDKLIAVVLPDPSVPDYEFYGSIWDGVRKRALELSVVGMDVVEYRFNGSMDDQHRLLEDILKDADGKMPENRIAGLVTLIWNENPFLDVIDEYAKIGIPFFTVTSDAPSSSRVASVRTNSYQTGRLAAEYLGSTIPHDGSVIITGTRRNAFSHEKVVRGFIDQMAVTNPDIQVIELYENKNGSMNHIQIVRNMIESVPDIRGIYANNARTTSLIGKLLLHSPQKDVLKIIGSEVSEESVFYLNHGVINALIDEQPYNQGYQCISLVYDFLCKGTPVKQTNYVSLNLVLQNNIPDIL